MLGRLHKRRCKPGDASREAAYVVTVAGSAGAFQVISELIASVRPDVDAAVVIILHGGRDLLADTLSLRSRIPVTTARHGETLRDRHAYVAPPGCHLIVNPDARLCVSAAPRRRLFRPSADWLFESASASYGRRHIAVVLSGTMTDGAAQLPRVKRAGGTVIVQDPDDATHPWMPRAALATGAVDIVVPRTELANAIALALSDRDRTVDLRCWDVPFDAALETGT